MTRQHDWSWTDLHDVRKQYSQPELRQKFEQLLRLYFSKKPTILKKYQDRTTQHFPGVRYPNFITTVQLFGRGKNNCYTDGFKVYRKTNSDKKTLTLDGFLTLKFDKIELVMGIKSLIDIEHFINVLEKKGGPIEVAEIENATIRRDALRFYGIAQFFKDMNARVIHQQGKNELLRLRWRDDESPITMVKVLDSTTKDVYLLRVPPEMKTVQEARAWTFGMKADEFYPLKET